jgi:hypothetical protein
MRFFHRRRVRYFRRPGDVLTIKIQVRRHPWRANLVISTIALSIAVLMLNQAVSMAQDRSGSGAKAAASPASRLPANYRQLMAQYMRTHNRYVVRDAKISTPYEKYGGLFRGGTYAAVCVAIFRDNPFGVVVRDNRVLTFENGQVKELALGLDTCSDLSAFTELKQQ